MWTHRETAAPSPDTPDVKQAPGAVAAADTYPGSVSGGRWDDQADFRGGLGRQQRL